MTMSNTPTRVSTCDKTTRRRAAGAVAKAYVGSLLFWVSLIAFGSLFTVMTTFAVQAYQDQTGAGVFSLWMLLALVCLALAFVYVPLATGVTIYRARNLYYLDTGTARAALATKPDRRKNALPGDVQAHTCGAWPKERGAGKTLGEWVRDDVHARGGRLTATALPHLAETYKKYGMTDDGRTAGFLVRVASKERN